MYVYAFMYVCICKYTYGLTLCYSFLCFFLFTCYQYWLFTCQWHCECKREGESQLRVHMSLSLEKYYCFLRYITTKYAAIPNVLSLSLFLYFCLCLSLCLREVTVLIGGVGCAVIIEQANWRLHKYATHTHTHMLVCMNVQLSFVVGLFVCDAHKKKLSVICTLLLLSACVCFCVWMHFSLTTKQKQKQRAQATHIA